MREKVNSVVSRFTTRKSKRQLSKAYLKRNAEVETKWNKRKPDLDEMIADLEYLVGIRKELVQ